MAAAQPRYRCDKVKLGAERRHEVRTRSACLGRLRRGERVETIGICRAFTEHVRLSARASSRVPTSPVRRAGFTVRRCQPLGDAQGHAFGDETVQAPEAPGHRRAVQRQHRHRGHRRRRGDSSRGGGLAEAPLRNLPAMSGRRSHAAAGASASGLAACTHSAAGTPNSCSMRTASSSEGFRFRFTSSNA